MIFAWPVSRSGDGFESDVLTHFLLLHQTLHGTWWSYTALYYPLRLVTAGTSEPQLIIQAGFMLLGVIAAAKVVMTAALLMNEGYRALGGAVTAVMLSTALALPLPFWADSFYLGTSPPNSLGSATQPLANAMAIPAIWALCAWFERPERRRLLLVAGAGLLSALAKPALTPAWVVGTAVLVAWMAWRGPLRPRQAVGSWLAIAGLPIATLLINLQTSYGGGAQREVHLRPLAELSPTLPVDLLRSWAFPVAVAVALAWEARRPAPAGALRDGGSVRWSLQTMAPAWLLLAAATAQAQLFWDTDRNGVPIGFGDMNWGAMAAASGLYAVSAMALVRVSPRRRILPFAILAVQTVAALVHLRNWVQTGSYF
jgi:preprotein translocase subunit Sec61beta